MSDCRERLKAATADGCSELVPSPWRPGDVLRFRETWRITSAPNAPYSGLQVEYRADGVKRYLDFEEYELAERFVAEAAPWRFPVTMPAWASRLSRTVKAVRAVKLDRLVLGDVLDVLGKKATDLDAFNAHQYWREDAFAELEAHWTEDHPRLPLGEAWSWALTIEKAAEAAGG